MLGAPQPRALSAAFLVCGVFHAAAAGQSLHPDAAPGEDAYGRAGLVELVERVGAGEQPTGLGVRISQVEASDGDGYAPDPSGLSVSAERISFRSGPSGASSHATRVGRALTRIAPRVTAIDAYDALAWLSGGFLNGSGPIPPAPAPAKIINNSWIGHAGAASNAYLRKLDYAVHEQELLVVSGVNNGIGALDVPLVACHFNGIAVGRSDGQHRTGATRRGVDGPGRMKPDLVAPAAATSFATPLVSAAGALMTESASTAQRVADGERASSPLVLKAVLLSGATHRPGWSNGAPMRGPARGATSTPLDAVFGAGELNVNRSHWILTAGEGRAARQPTSPPVDPAGWSLVEIEAGESRWFPIRIASPKPFASIVASWNRRVSHGFDSYSMPDFDLELWREGPAGEPERLVGEGGVRTFGSGNVLSDSLVDNVEHLYLRDLQPGLYWIELRRKNDTADGARSVAVAWHFPPPEPAAFGVGKRGARGQVPVLGWRGLPATFANDFWLTVEGAPGERVAFVLSGTERSQLPFRGGTLLVGSDARQIGWFPLDREGRGEWQLELRPEWVGTKRVYQVLLHGGGMTNAVEVVFER